MSVVVRYSRGSALVVAVALLVSAGAPVHASGAPGDAAFLDTAASFSVIGGSTVTNTGASVLDAGLAVSPGSATTGFPPGIFAGTVHSHDAVAIQAQVDVTTAVNAIMAVPSYNVGGADLDGTTFLAGSYSSATSLLNTGTITLQGDADDVFIFTAVSTLTTGSGSTMVFTSGAQECNVFWRVGSSATLGSGSHLAGTVIAQASVSANTLATISGRLLAQTGAVTLQSNVFSAPACVTSGGDGLSGGPSGTVPGETAPIATPSGPTGPVLPIPQEIRNETPAAPQIAPTGVDATWTIFAAVAALGVGFAVLLFGYRRRSSAAALRNR